MLKNVRIKKYELHNEYLVDRQLSSARNNPVPTHSVWDFITKFTGGATFEVTNLSNQNAPPNSVDAAFNQINKMNNGAGIGSPEQSPEQAKHVGEGIQALVQHDEEGKNTIEKVGPVND